MDVSIRRVAVPGELRDDVAAVLDELDDVCIGWSYPKRDRYWWLAIVGGYAVGFAGLEIWEDENTGFLCRAGVHPSYRGLRIQRRLIHARLRQARRLGLERCVTYTVADNPMSMNSLIRAGFRIYQPQHAWVGRNMIYFFKKTQTNQHVA